jgi:predicted metal-dependent hydrolase
MSPTLPVEIEPVAKRKSATAQIREGVIQVQVPRHWPKDLRAKISTQLAQQVQQQFKRDYHLAQNVFGPTLTFEPAESEFSEWAHELNHRTLNVPVKKIRIGQSKYTHLAQMNIKTRTMTVSKFCLQEVPESALRYLVVHELTHLRVADHSQAFWSIVSQFVPDYRHQRRLIAAIHRVRIFEADRKPVVVQPSLFDWLKWPSPV